MKHYSGANTKPFVIHSVGIFLFLFIPLVLYLFLRFPFGILPSFGVAIVIMFSHRFVAGPFMHHHRSERCFWCGRTARPRVSLTVTGGGNVELQFCEDGCISKARRFFDFCAGYRILFRTGIFLPLAWYVITMLLVGLKKFSFPEEWNRFIFQFFIACSVVSISFLYSRGREVESPTFPFPIHNLFLLGAKNTLLVFRYVGIWWIVAGLYFVYTRFSS